MCGAISRARGPIARVVERGFPFQMSSVYAALLRRFRGTLENERADIMMVGAVKLWGLYGGFGFVVWVA